MEITGTIKKIEDAQQVTEKLRKQNFIVDFDLDKQYPKTICFEVLNDKIQTFAHLMEGQNVKVQFEVSSREYSGKYYTSAKAYKIEAV
jgi:hypothetical protein